MGGSSSVVRGLSVLNVILEAGHIRAEAISDRTSLPKSTVYRYLQPLLEHGLVLKSAGGFEVGHTMRSPQRSQHPIERLDEISRPALEEVVAITGETALIVIRLGLHAVVHSQVESQQMDRIAYTEGALIPLHAGAAARAILAHAPAKVLSAVISKGLIPVTSSTFDESQLLASLEQIRDRGYATSEEELSHGGVAVAAPIKYEGMVLGSICAQGPRHRCSSDWQIRTQAQLRQVAESLTMLLESSSAPA